jgi:acyl-coenzyme A thioesterase PaaI-like protein
VTAIQDLMTHNHCYGCGPDNDKGMQIKSYWEGDTCVCRYQPKPEQCAGPRHYVYGGTIASLIDCHCVCTATSNFYRLEGRETGSVPEIWCVTGRLTVSYSAPTPIDKEIELRATIEECTEKKAVVKCEVFSDGSLTATGEVVAIRVPESWKNE